LNHYNGVDAIGIANARRNDLELKRELIIRAIDNAYADLRAIQYRITDAKRNLRDLGLKLMLLPVHAPDQLIGAFQTASRGQVEALVVIEDSVATRNMVEILSLSAKNSLAVVSQYKAFAEAGAILASGPSPLAMYHRAAYYVDRILKGANTGDLPVEEPSKFDLIINLKPAKALGVTIPESLLLRADEVIE
jgi:putative tryptophan/tyrosine transport system substrate-binding protein